MKLKHSVEQIKEAQSLLEEAYEKATKVTEKYFEIVQGEKLKTTPYVEDLEFQGEDVIAQNTLDHQYDYKGTEYLTNIKFPTKWLYVENLDELEEEMLEIKNEKEKIKKRIAKEAEKMMAEKREKEEKQQLRNLQKKYPNMNEKTDH